MNYKNTCGIWLTSDYLAFNLCNMVSNTLSCFLLHKLELCDCGSEVSHLIIKGIFKILILRSMHVYVLYCTNNILIKWTIIFL